MDAATGPLDGVVPGSPGGPRLVVIGESTAAGTGAPDHEMAIAGNLARGLAERTGQEVRWRVLGRNGAVAREVTAELVPQLDEGGAETTHVLVLIGVNDLRRTWRRGAWRQHLTTLLSGVQGACPNARVVISGLPRIADIPVMPAAVVPFLTRKAITMGIVTRRVARRLGVVYAPIDHIALPADEFSPDRFHPAPALYARWARHLVPAVAGG